MLRLLGECLDADKLERISAGTIGLGERAAHVHGPCVRIAHARASASTHGVEHAGHAARGTRRERRAAGDLVEYAPKMIRGEVSGRLLVDLAH